MRSVSTALATGAALATGTALATGANLVIFTKNGGTVRCPSTFLSLGDGVTQAFAVIYRNDTPNWEWLKKEIGNEMQ